MNVPVRLLAIAAFALALPAAVQAAPPVVIGDGSVCLDTGKGGSPFPDKGNTHAYSVSIARIIVDTPSAGSACAPQVTCKGAQACSEHNATDAVVVFYVDAANPSSVASSITVTNNAAGNALNFALGGADWSQFADFGGSGRTKIINKAVKIDKVMVGGNRVQCSPCRVTLVAK